MTPSIETIARQKTDGFSMVEKRYPPGLLIPFHIHARAHFYVVLAGGQTERTFQSTRSTGAGTVVFHPPGIEHDNEVHGSGAQVLHVDVEPKTAEYAREHGIPLSDSLATLCPSMFQCAGRIRKELVEWDSASPLAVEGLLFEMLAQTMRRPGPSETHGQPIWLVRARDYLDSNVSAELRISDIAKEVAIHPSHLASEFRRHFGLTIGAYQRAARIQLACSLLREPSRSIGIVAHDCGFGHQAHFGRAFRRQVGMTPSQYRREFAKNP